MANCCVPGVGYTFGGWVVLVVDVVAVVAVVLVVEVVVVVGSSLSSPSFLLQENTATAIEAIAHKVRIFLFIVFYFGPVNYYSSLKKTNLIVKPPVLC